MTTTTTTASCHLQDHLQLVVDHSHCFLPWSFNSYVYTVYMPAVGSLLYMHGYGLTANVKHYCIGECQDDVVT